MKPATIETSAGTNFARMAPQECAGLDVNRTADYLGVGRSMVYVVLNRGLIKSVQIGSRRIILRNSLDDYLKSLRS
jgi:excisionase family DNA binding protein